MDGFVGTNAAALLQQNIATATRKSEASFILEAHSDSEQSITDFE
jgi:hypothetical protein